MAPASCVCASVNCEIASKCDPTQNPSSSLITPRNTPTGWGQVSRDRCPPQIRMFTNRINALRDFRGGVIVGRDFTLSDNSLNIH